MKKNIEVSKKSLVENAYYRPVTLKNGTEVRLLTVKHNNVEKTLKPLKEKETLEKTEFKRLIKLAKERNYSWTSKDIQTMIDSKWYFVTDADMIVARNNANKLSVHELECEYEHRFGTVEETTKQVELEN